jgi:hypothetical protein
MKDVIHELISIAIRNAPHCFQEEQKRIYLSEEEIKQLDNLEKAKPSINKDIFNVSEIVVKKKESELMEQKYENTENSKKPQPTEHFQQHDIPTGNSKIIVLKSGIPVSVTNYQSRYLPENVKIMSSKQMKKMNFKKKGK